MRSSGPYRSLLSGIAMLWVLCVGCSSASAQSPHSYAAARTGGHACPHDDSELELPSGFCATVFADGIGHARHLVVAPNGVVYVNTWSGRYYGKWLWGEVATLESRKRLPQAWRSPKNIARRCHRWAELSSPPTRCQHLRPTSGA
jgi:glucose/arabinose dehydrogenase